MRESHDQSKAAQHLQHRLQLSIIFNIWVTVRGLSSSVTGADILILLIQQLLNRKEEGSLFNIAAQLLLLPAWLTSNLESLIRRVGAIGLDISPCCLLS